jgi:hypothetical protein
MLRPMVGIGETLGNQRGTEMDQIELYKGFRIRAYEDWSGQWLAEAKKPFDTDAEYIATPSGHPTTQAAIAFMKQMIQ